MNKKFDYYSTSLTAIFKKLPPREAHHASKSILLEMAQNKDILMEIIARNISAPGFFSKKRINPVIAMSVLDNPHVTIVANFWLPLPDRATDISHQSVHHHGKLILTSVSPYGPGYESVIFKPGFSIDHATEKASMTIDKQYKNPLHNLEFIDANTPHIVFYPKDLSVTYAVWTYNERSFSGMIRKNPFIQKNKKLLLKVLGLFKQTAVVNKVEYFDFYPYQKGLQAMKERVMYPAGSNENFIQNIFYILQHVGFNKIDLLESILKKYPDPERLLGMSYLAKLKSGEAIEDSFEQHHLNISKINFSKEELLKATSF